MSSSPPLRESTGAESSSSKRTRSRNGCLVCRARRIKCDLERPECKRCVTYGAECVYPLKKAFDPAAVDAALGSRHNRPSNVAAHATKKRDSSRDGSVAELTPTSQSRPDERSAIDSLPPMEMVHALFRQTKMGSFYSNPVDPPEFLRMAFPQVEDLRCFHHCLTYSLSILVVDEDHNPWVEHIAPMFLFPTGDAPLSTNALKHSMLAIGATHLAYLEASRRLPTAESTLAISRRYRQAAMSSLRQARRIPAEMSHDAFLAASVLIVDNDILAASVSWREPLRYAMASITHRGGPGQVLFGPGWNGPLLAGGTKDLPPPRPIPRYLVEHLVVLDMISSFVKGTPPSVLTLSSGWWEALGNTGTTDREWESVESLAGFHRGIVRISSTVSTLRADFATYQQHHGSIDTLEMTSFDSNPQTMTRIDLVRRLTDLQIEMATWRGEAPARYMNPRTQIGSMALWHALHIFVLRDMLKRAREDDEVQSSAAAVLELCIEVGDKVEFMNWPLLIACSVLIEESKRDTVRQIIKTFAYQCCHELEVMRLVIEEMWLRIDEGFDDEACSWREISIEIGRPVLLG